MQVFLIPTAGDRLEGPVVVVLGCADALHTVGQTSGLGGHAESSSVARELNAVSINFQATCTLAPDQCRRKRVEGACRKAFEAPGSQP